MPNKNYLAGRRREYAIKHYLEAKGMVVCRTAGSHSQFDLLALDPSSGKIYLIQVKPTSMSRKEKDRLQSKISWAARDWVGKTLVVSFGKEVT